MYHPEASAKLSRYSTLEYALDQRVTEGIYGTYPMPVQYFPTPSPPVGSSSWSQASHQTSRRPSISCVKPSSRRSAACPGPIVDIHFGLDANVGRIVELGHRSQVPRKGDGLNWLISSPHEVVDLGRDQVKLKIEWPAYHHCKESQVKLKSLNGVSVTRFELALEAARTVTRFWDDLRFQRVKEGHQQWKVDHHGFRYSKLYLNRLEYDGRVCYIEVDLEE